MFSTAVISLVHQNSVLCGNFTTESRLLKTQYKKPFENMVRKGENAGNQHFLLFPQCFLPFPEQISIFSVAFILSSATAFNFEWSKIFSFVKELNDPFENIVEKGENAGNRLFHTFPQCFPPYQRSKSSF